MLNVIPWFSLLIGMYLPFNTDPQKVFKTRYENFQVDNLGNIYTINKEELVKFQPSGKLFARYSNLRLGNITSIDPSNPLKILVYYRDFQQIVFLDNQLSVNSDMVSLETLGLEQTELVCASANNGFWVYNKQNNELIRFNENSQRTASTGNLKLLLDSRLSPTYMVEHNGFLYISGPDSGITVFDIFGTFMRFIPIKGLQSFQVGNDLIFFQRDSLLCGYEQKLLQETCTPFGKPHAKLYWTQQAIYQGFRDSIVVTPR